MNATTTRNAFLPLPPRFLFASVSVFHPRALPPSLLSPYTSARIHIPALLQGLTARANNNTKETLKNRKKKVTARAGDHTAHQRTGEASSISYVLPRVTSERRRSDWSQALCGAYLGAVLDEDFTFFCLYVCVCVRVRACVPNEWKRRRTLFHKSERLAFP